MSQVLQQLEFSVCAFGQDGCAERLHDLFHGNGLAGQLIPRRACPVVSAVAVLVARRVYTYHTRPNAPIPTGCKSVYLQHGQSPGLTPRHRGGERGLPAGDLEGGPKDLGAHKFGHDGRGVGSESLWTKHDTRWADRTDTV